MEDINFFMSHQSNSCEIGIIGGGPAGLTAAIYASRARRKTIIFEQIGSGGQILITYLIENYPGFPDGISGYELGQLFENQAKRFGTEIVLASASGLKIGHPYHTIITDKGEFICGAIIIASGASHRKLNVPGEKELEGRGVSYCGTCDAMFFKGKEVVVIGGGDAAIDEAIFLTKFVSKLTVVHRRDKLRAAKIIQERAFANPKINFMWDSIITEILGDTEKGVRGVKVKNNMTGEESIFPTGGVFVFIGHTPNSSFLPPEIEKAPDGTLITNFKMETNIKGIYAAGDIRRDTIRQIITSAGEGATAGFYADKYLETLKERMKDEG